MSTVRDIARNAGIIFTGNTIYRLISLVVTIYLARYLGVAEFGKFNFLYAYLSFFTLITDFGLSTVLIREIVQNKDKTPELIGNGLIITFLLAILSFGLSISIILVTSYPADTILYIFITSFSIFFISFTGVYTSIFRANHRMEYNLIAKIVSRILTAILTIVIILIDGGLLYLVILMVVGDLINTLINYIYSRKFAVTNFNLNTEISKNLLKESFPIALSAMFAAVYTNIDQIMLSSMSGDASVGYYSAALKVVTPLGLLTSGLTMSLFPVMSSYAAESREKISGAFVKSLRYILLISLPIAVCISFMSKYIIYFVFGPEFMPAYTALIILIWVQLFICINTVSIDTLTSLHEQKIFTKVSLAGAVFNIALNYLLIPKYDFYGSSFATVLTEMFILLLLFPSISKKIDIFLINKSIIKIFSANLILALYLYFLTPIFNPCIVAFTSVLLYFTAYYLMGGIEDVDKKIFRKLVSR